MGIEINKLSNSSYVQKELTEINKLNSTSVEKDEEENSEKTTDKKTGDKKTENLDTYKKSSTVSNSIEQQIKEQEAKIKEINENLAVLRESYNETGEAEDAARSERYLKERERYQKELSENSLKRIFASWTKKYKANESDTSILKNYNATNTKYETAIDERKSADEAYDLADTEAYEAIQAHNSSSAQFISGLWGKRDAYWDLAKMQRRLAVAKLKESMDR
jgi:hypothetical protein